MRLAQSPAKHLVGDTLHASQESRFSCGIIGVRPQNLTSMRTNNRNLKFLVALSALCCIGCLHQSRPPDLTGFITALPRTRLRVESDTTDPLNGHHSPKAIVSLEARISRSNLRVGCLVQVWYDPNAPIKESYPVQVVAEAVRVVRCPPLK
jgi:hypothetical protein